MPKEKPYNGDNIEQQLADTAVREAVGEALDTSEMTEDEMRIKLAEVMAKNADLEDQNTILAHRVEILDNENAELRKQATLDPLTGLPNRRFLFGEEHKQGKENEEIENPEKVHGVPMADKIFDEAMRYKHPLSVAMVDLDHFKELNDRYTHEAGDQVLQAVARVFDETLRTSDLAGRYGGEEFVFLLPETNTQDAMVVLNRVNEKLQNLVFELEKHEKDERGKLKGTGEYERVSVTVSTGLVSIQPEQHEVKNAKELIGLADEAVYQAKAEGRNRIVINKI